MASGAGCGAATSEVREIGAPVFGLRELVDDQIMRFSQSACAATEAAHRRVDHLEALVAEAKSLLVAEPGP